MAHLHRLGLGLSILLLLARAASAQSIPLTVAWDADPPDQNVLHYTVTLDGVVVGTPTGTSQAFTVTPGVHTVAVTASSATTTSAATTLQITCQTTCVVGVAPAAPTGLTITPHP